MTTVARPGTERMSANAAVAAVHAARGARDIVVTTMTPARDWMLLPAHPLDLVLVPSAMGGAPSLGLGLALAQPNRRVIVLNGDGSMLMNLGALVTIAESRATNLFLVVFQNGTYEVTGSQRLPGGASVDFGAIARGSGMTSTYDYASDSAWSADVARLIAAPGPTFVTLHVEPVLGRPGPKSPGPASARGASFAHALHE
ncbi:MAG: thiamine pyrophosphate-dependent enzyme [Gemmatimonadales bacterium]|jgi:thiamine pyrophosphate-dependent acetolactate synthase large subunit-like protein